MKSLIFLFSIVLCVSCDAIYDERLYDLKSDEKQESIYYKNVDFGIVPSDFYWGQSDDYSFGNSKCKTMDIYDMFDSLTNYRHITKEFMGKASDGSDMYFYKYTSPTPVFWGTANNKREKNKLKLIIVCGQHGFEKSSIYGSLYFLRDVCSNYKNYSVLQYFHQYSDIIIIPCANPYGIDNNVTVNANGVNLNRNWPVNGWRQNEESIFGTTKYAGNSGGDQPEVQNIISVLNMHSDALLVLDFHTKGAGIQTKESINWLSMTLPDDPYRDLLIEIGNYHICNITSAFEYMYSEEIGDSDTMCGYMDASSTYSRTGFLSTYAAQHGFLSVTFEGFNGFPNDTKPFQNKVKKANSELLGNYLVTLCYILAKYDSEFCPINSY